jgi:hypothetical protein
LPTPKFKHGSLKISKAKGYFCRLFVRLKNL